MPDTTDTFISALKGLRQSRRFHDKPIPQDIVAELLEVARWTGSAKNTQPWEFIVIDDRAALDALAAAGAFTRFLDNVPLAIAIVLDNTSPRSESYDEGRVSERLMLAADHLGLGSGTAWFSTPDAQDVVREILGVPADRIVWSVVGFGYVDESAPQRSASVPLGRKPLEEIVSYGRFGSRQKP